MTSSRPKSLVGFILCSILLLPAAQGAAFDGDQIKCREAISKSGSKLADKAVKELVTCHKKRSKGKISQSVDCNDISQADTKNKVGAAATKLQSDAASKCGGQTPADLNYVECPVPCDVTVPSIVDFTDVTDCITCLAEAASQDMTQSAQGLPTPPLPKVEGKCHSAIGKNLRKQFKTVIKERRKCQKADEALGGETTSNCSGADPNGKISSGRTKAETSILKSCDVEGIDLFAVDSCNKILPQLLATCVLDGADDVGDSVFVSLYELFLQPVTTTTAQVTTTTNSVTTTTGSVTTTTLGGGQDPQCPASGEIVLYAAVRVTPCTTNVDCEVDGALVGVCDTGLGQCATDTRLDTGWTGVGHGQDINDEVSTRGFLRCPGPFDGGSSEPCGECEVLGLDTTSSDLCRCSNDNGIICSDKFALDAASCTVGGVACTVDDDCKVCETTTTQSCLADADCPGSEVCLSGLRRPTCVANQCVGTCDCFFGAPLPLSAGNVPACALNKFANDVSGTANVDLGAGEITANLKAVVYSGEDVTVPCPYCDGDITPGDGVRDGTCQLGEDHGKPCDVGAPNLTFPAPAGGGHSLDCFPTLGKNISGTGLKIDLVQTTGTRVLPSAVECGFSFAPELCPCGTCSGNAVLTCTSNADCAAEGAGTCGKVGQGNPRQQQCDSGDICVDLGGGLGECETGPILKFCDGAVRANGEPYVACINQGSCDNTDCGSGAGAGLCGTCSLQRVKQCFLPTIIAEGQEDPQAPLGAATFCVPPTASFGINSTVGLPGPARITNQTRSRTFCSSDPGTEYVPGTGGCP